MKHFYSRWARILNIIGVKSSRQTRLSPDGHSLQKVFELNKSVWPIQEKAWTGRRTGADDSTQTSVWFVYCRCIATDPSTSYPAVHCVGAALWQAWTRSCLRRATFRLTAAWTPVKFKIKLSEIHCVHPVNGYKKADFLRIKQPFTNSNTWAAMAAQHWSYAAGATW